MRDEDGDVAPVPPIDGVRCLDVDGSVQMQQPPPVLVKAIEHQRRSALSIRQDLLQYLHPGHVVMRDVRLVGLLRADQPAVIHEAEAIWLNLFVFAAACSTLASVSPISATKLRFMSSYARRAFVGRSK